MFVKGMYLGFYPLGSDVTVNGIKLMQAEWDEYKRLVVVIGKKGPVNPLFDQVHYVKEDNRIVFFAAREYGLGHYHVFLLDERAQQKLAAKIVKR